MIFNYKNVKKYKHFIITSMNNNWREASTLEIAQSFGLFDTEYDLICSLFNKTPTILEIGICSALFSEHCSYKSTKAHLSNLPTTAKGINVLVGPGENAGIVDIGDNQAVAFKVESHNHPSFIEPFQGAATGVGGILRDIFTMGARPLACLNSLRFGEVTNKKASHLLNGAVSGIGTYGNCMGIPTIGGELYFHKSYNGNCLVNAFALGLVEHDKIFLGSAEGVGNSLIYVGSKTGSDGIHGATMASEEFNEDSESKRPTVQVGDPFQEKLLMEACLEAMNTEVIIGIQDMGAAGMTSSAFEMAERAGSGVRIDLDKVPMRETEMTPYEIMLSESQERMLLVVQKGKEQEIFDIFDAWDLDSVLIGEVTDTETVQLYWFGELVSDMPAKALADITPKYKWEYEAPKRDNLSFDHLSKFEKSLDLKSDWLSFLSSPNICSRSEVFNRYDSTVRSNTAILPGGDAGVIRIKNNSNYSLSDKNHKDLKKSSKPEKGIAISLDCNSRYCYLDPKVGTELSICESLRNITAVGAKPLGISDCLNFGSPQKKEGMYQIKESIDGIGNSCKKLNVPVISGNVSLYNETNGSAIYPTPTIAMVGLLEDVSKAQSIYFKNVKDRVIVLGEVKEEHLLISEYFYEKHKAEDIEFINTDFDKEIKTANLIRELIDLRLLNSCHDISTGGLASAVVESCLNAENSFGVKLETENDLELELFAEAQGRYIISVSDENYEKVVSMIEKASLFISVSGVVQKDIIELNDLSIDLKEAEKSYFKFDI